jgi:uncharacterized protein
LHTFRDRAPWWGGDLQTVRNFLMPDVGKLLGKSTQLIFATSDGSSDQLMATLDEPIVPENSPLIILIHGLSGSEESSYVKASAAFHLKRGRCVLRLNLRGAGPSWQTCKRHYHGGHVIDIFDALSGLKDHITGEGVFLIGYSLGGNILVNFLAVHKNLPILGAVSVSASIDPAGSANRLMAPRNALYQAWLLNHMKKESLERVSHLNEESQQVIKSARSIYDFDDKFTAPQNGFKDAPDYYHQTNGARNVKNITIPLIMIHARNDPWIPYAPYEKLMECSPDNIKVLLTNSGGHVGFHDRASRETWHDRIADEFISSICVL